MITWNKQLKYGSPTYATLLLFAVHVKTIKLSAYLVPFYQQLKLFGLVHTLISALFFSPSAIGGQGIQQLILLTTIISFDKVSIDIQDFPKVKQGYCRINKILPRMILTGLR